MLRTLAFAAIAAVAGRQLYKSGALGRFGDDLKRRSDELKQRMDERRANAAPVRATTRATATPGSVPPVG